MRPVIVLGTAPCMWADLEALEPIVQAAGVWCDVCAVNKAGLLYSDPIAWWVSVHGGQLREWYHEREALGYPMGFKALGNCSGNVDIAPVIRWHRPNHAGSSALYAVGAMIEQGYTRIVLCGVPLDGITRIDRGGDEVVGDHDEPVRGYSIYRQGWLRVPEVGKCTRSMSGWTAEHLGRPTATWLAGENK